MYNYVETNSIIGQSLQKEAQPKCQGFELMDKFQLENATAIKTSCKGRKVKKVLHLKGNFNQKCCSILQIYDSATLITGLT